MQYDPGEDDIMLLKLFFVFILLPIVEIFILMQVSAYFGPLTAIILIVGTGFFGASLAKIQGMQAINRIRENMKMGLMPGDDVVDAFLIFVAGILLILPGLLTDIFGILLLIPVTRRRARNHLTKALNKRINDGSLRFKRY
jgi:UPF0716 protein FxsA